MELDECTILNGHTENSLLSLLYALQIPRAEGIFSHQYVVTVNITPSENLPRDSLLIKQSARTRGRIPQRYQNSEHEVVNWSELFFFKVDSLVCEIFISLTLINIESRSCLKLEALALR